MLLKIEGKLCRNTFTYSQKRSCKQQMHVYAYAYADSVF